MLECPFCGSYNTGEFGHRSSYTGIGFHAKVCYYCRIVFEFIWIKSNRNV